MPTKGPKEAETPEQNQQETAPRRNAVAAYQGERMPKTVQKTPQRRHITATDNNVDMLIASVDAIKKQLDVIIEALRAQGITVWRSASDALECFVTIRLLSPALQPGFVD